MTTLIIKVDNKKNANLLSKLLKSMAFVKNVEEDFTDQQITDQYGTLKKIFKSIKPGSIYKNIDNPIEWQKQIRNEW